MRQAISSTVAHEPERPCAPVLRPDLLARTHELNCDYLELLAGECANDDCGGQLQYFAPKHAASLAALSVDERARIARVPYSLYSLRFEDTRLWRGVCGGAAQHPIRQRYVAPADSSPHTQFFEIALIQAWHIANTHPLAARVLYAMGDEVRMRVAAMPLWRIKRIASERMKVMTPRWPTNPCFWPDLIAFAKSGDALRLATAQMLGTQLIAAELARTRLR